MFTIEARYKNDAVSDSILPELHLNYGIKTSLVVILNFYSTSKATAEGQLSWRLALCIPSSR